MEGNSLEWPCSEPPPWEGKQILNTEPGDMDLILAGVPANCVASRKPFNLSGP